MKKIIFFCFIFAVASALMAQDATFDLVDYTPPMDWKKDTLENALGYTITNNKNNSWCHIRIEKSTVSKGNIDLDFESEWQELIVKNYQPSYSPDLRELPDKDGWKWKFGSTTFTFDDKPASAMLTTMSGFDRCVSISAITNSTDYFEDIKALMMSVSLKKPEAVEIRLPSIFKKV